MTTPIKLSERPLSARVEEAINDVAAMPCDAWSAEIAAEVRALEERVERYEKAAASMRLVIKGENADLFSDEERAATAHWLRLLEDTP